MKKGAETLPLVGASTHCLPLAPGSPPQGHCAHCPAWHNFLLTSMWSTLLTINSSFGPNVPPLKAHPSLNAVVTVAPSLPGPAPYVTGFKALTLHNHIPYLLIYLFTVSLAGTFP